MNMCWNVIFTEPFVERVPIAVTHRRCFTVASILIGIWIEKTSLKTELHTAIQLMDRHVERFTRRLRQTANTHETIRIKLGLPMDDVIYFLGEPLHQF